MWSKLKSWWANLWGVAGVVIAPELPAELPGDPMRGHWRVGEGDPFRCCVGGCGEKSTGDYQVRPAIGDSLTWRPLCAAHADLWQSSLPLGHVMAHRTPEGWQ